MPNTIMTVDDASTMRQMIVFTLKSAGHDVLQACDGKDALSQLTSRKIDLVITDVNMPNMNGIELTRELRKLPHMQRTPILILTTESEQSKKMEGRSAGATGWIVKPFNQESLLQVVGKVLPG